MNGQILLPIFLLPEFDLMAFAMGLNRYSMSHLGRKLIKLRAFRILVGEIDHNCVKLGVYFSCRQVLRVVSGCAIIAPVLWFASRHLWLRRRFSKVVLTL